MRFHIHVHHHFEGVLQMAVSAEFQAQLDRAKAFIAEQAKTIEDLKALSTADTDDTTALSAELDAAGAPAAAAPVQANAASA